MVSRDTYYFLLSGVHRTLPLAEFKGILEGEGINYKIVARLDQVILANTYGPSTRLIRSLSRRSSLIKYGGLVLSLSDVSTGLKAVKDVLTSIDLKNIGVDTVAFRRIKKYGEGLDYLKLMAELSKLGLRVSGRKGRGKVIDIILSEGVLIIGLRLFERNIKELNSRAPQVRPSYLPGTMTPLWCRLFVNLSRAGPGKLFLDPFCGVGGFLLEACHMDINYVGCDANPRCVEGSVINLTHYGCPPSVVVGDACKPPFNRADCISTDPPYGRLTRALGSGKLSELMERFIYSAAEILHKGSYLVFAQKRELYLEDVLTQAGFKIVERHLNWVHGSLTRDIYVVRKS